MECQICKKDMELKDSFNVLGFDKTHSKIEIYVCWDCRIINKKVGGDCGKDKN